MNDKDFIYDFCEDILREINPSLLDENKERLIGVLVGRVNSRVLLEIVALLSPEQVARLNQELKESNPEPGKLFREICCQVPDFEALVVGILTKLRGELVDDLKVLVMPS